MPAESRVWPRRHSRALLVRRSNVNPAQAALGRCRSFEHALPLLVIAVTACSQPVATGDSASSSASQTSIAPGAFSAPSNATMSSMDVGASPSSVPSASPVPSPSIEPDPTGHVVGEPGGGVSPAAGPTTSSPSVPDASSTSLGAGGSPGSEPTAATTSNPSSALPTDPEVSDAGAASTGSTDAGAAPAPALGATPPMGWNSWNTFGGNLDEDLIKGVADAMTQNGMRDAGYQYVNLDDGWMNGRDADGKLRWDNKKFPSGLPALADYVHGLGLKIGIYQSANNRTCLGIYGGYAADVAVGSLGHEQQDAETFADWGMDYLKYDLCAGSRQSLSAMGEAIRALPRPLLYSINPGNGQSDLDPPKAGWDMLGVANVWRIGFDIGPNWDAVIRLVDENAELYSFAGPGGFNDPDMLEVGKLASVDEDRAHFALWAIMAAPLIAGNDIRAMSDTTREILTNSEIIQVDQDPLGLQGRIVASPARELQVWAKTLSGSDVRAVVLFNRGSASASIAVSWSDLQLPQRPAQVRDLYQQADLGSFDDGYTASAVPAHGVVMLRIESSP